MNKTILILGLLTLIISLTILTIGCGSSDNAKNNSENKTDNNENSSSNDANEVDNNKEQNNTDNDSENNTTNNVANAVDNIPVNIIDNDSLNNDDNIVENSNENNSTNNSLNIDENSLAQGVLANIFVSDPITNNNETEEATLFDLTDVNEGKLIGKFVHAKNCLNEPGGESMMGFAELCIEKSVAAQENGSYLHIEPPSSFTDPDDLFAEVMMYFHVDKIHDFFKDNFGLTRLDQPISATVNFQVFARDSWMAFDNAMFLPSEMASSMFGMERESDSIIFGQGSSIDFSYDSSVIYHEYTHAVISEDRLYGYRPDEWGMDVTPMSLSEGMADYFAATLSGDPVIGNYALKMIAPGMGYDRILSEDRSLPNDWFAESHAGGRVWSSALWAIRTKVGQDVSDDIIFDALLNMELTTGLKQAVEIVLQSAKDIGGDEVEADFKAIFEEKGMIEAIRIKPLDKEVFGSQVIPLVLNGNQVTGYNGFPGNITPALVQYSFEVPEDAKAIDIKWSAQSMGFMGGGGSQAQLKLGVNVNEPVKYEYDSSGNATINAVYVSNQSQSGIMLGGDCFETGTYYLHVLVPPGGQFQLSSFSVTVITDDIIAAEANSDWCD